MIEDWKRAFGFFGLKPSNKLHPGVRYAGSKDAVGAMFNRDAARQRSDSPYFGGGNPGPAAPNQTTLTYRHLSEPGFVSSVQSPSGGLLLKKFDN
jgi:hypothetical protein